MLNQNDIDLIKSFRQELETLRTTPVTLERLTVTGYDPYTKEPITTVSTVTVDAIVKGFTGQVGGEQLLVNGVVIQAGDVSMTFNAGVDLTGIKAVWHEGINYVLINILPRGIGGTNRFECIARRAN